jgi:hypothetical protein
MKNLNFTNSCTINMNWNIYTYDTFLEKSVKTINSNNCAKFEVNWPRGPWPIYFKLRIVIGIDSLMVCILFGEISVFHSRVMGLYSSNCRQFFVQHAQRDLARNHSGPTSVKWNLKWIGQGVLKLEHDMWNGRTDSRTLVYHNTSRLTDGCIKIRVW